MSSVSFFFGPVSGFMILLVVSFFSSVACDIEQGKEFNPSDSRYFDVIADWCPVSFAEEGMHFFVKSLAVSKSMFAFRWLDNLDVLALQFQQFFVPYPCFCFHPFEGIVATSCFEDGMLCGSFCLFNKGDPNIIL